MIKALELAFTITKSMKGQHVVPVDYAEPAVFVVTMVICYSICYQDDPTIKLNIEITSECLGFLTSYTKNHSLVTQALQTVLQTVSEQVFNLHRLYMLKLQ